MTQVIRGKLGTPYDAFPSQHGDDKYIRLIKILSNCSYVNVRMMRVSNRHTYSCFFQPVSLLQSPIVLTTQEFCLLKPFLSFIRRLKTLSDTSAYAYCINVVYRIKDKQGVINRIEAICAAKLIEQELLRTA